MKIQLNGVSLSYRDEGAGLPILFVHAFALNQSMWDAQVAALSSNFRVITLDLRGHGDSDAPAWFYTMEQLAEDVAALMDHLSLPRVILAGLSLGGYVLFSFYRGFKGRVIGLILADTRSQSEPSEGVKNRFEMAQLATREGPSSVADVMIPKLLCRTSLLTRVDLIKKVRGMIQSTPVAGILGGLMGMALRPDATGLLPQITCPTLILVGEEDPLTPPNEARIMAERISNATYVTIPSAAHLPNMEQEEAFNAAVLKFARSVT